LGGGGGTTLYLKLMKDEGLDKIHVIQVRGQCWTLQ
jgi:hypothetical protein